MLIKCCCIGGKFMKIYARNTIVKSIDEKTVTEFMNNYHRQQMPTKYSNLISYGLYHNNELVAAICFSNPRTRNKQLQYCHELLRMCFKENIRVIGGASRMVKHFIQQKQPYNFFTWQDSGGENTKVYEHCGMKLVSKARNKTVLVRNGITYNTAENNRKDWFSIEQVNRYGADSLLKTKIGEKHKEDGRRYTNVEIFTEYLGYHIETIAGDNLYEWHNPLKWHYVYKITADDSDKYYFGRKTITSIQQPTIQECINDGYYGSGGTKYKNWLKKHNSTLRKEILGVHYLWSDAVKAEEEYIGDNYKKDKNCLNSSKGGLSIGAGNGTVEYKNCDIHGETKHRGSSCLKCVVIKSIKKKHCDTHGYSSHIGDSCFKCVADRTKYSPQSRGHCDLHGDLKTKKCIKCSYEMRKCSIHGETKHRNDKCLKCISVGRKQIVLQYCLKHGGSQENLENCPSCISLNTFDTGDCVLHGRNVKFRKGKCVSCSNTKNISYIDCLVCGRETLHSSLECFECSEKKYFVSIDDYSPKNVGTKTFFSCPECSHRWSNKRQIVLSHILNNVSPCSQCRMADSFWESTEELKTLSKYCTPLPRLWKIKGNVVHVHCIDCGYDREGTVLTFVRKIRDNGYPCDCCHTGGKSE